MALLAAKVEGQISTTYVYDVSNLGSIQPVTSFTTPGTVVAIPPTIQQTAR